ncbi:hypothetical protein GCM10010503_32930 [Streptomyces lucensis JCM 4490]|uniref:Secreted protein n=1 Tax=Streptomyces lucensis JCM 4490 TaxID=1306176 RepID=A0A918MS05_9ACTN|nr:DUF6344 domain-containing protein [Streptomyces lucensis]GGW53188.1 hypothetical protein GCM10010503_32930 [Streptomyces lucensis JCM 4490]
MAQNKVMKLWTAIVTAFLALCTALGLASAGTATAAPAAGQPEGPRTGTEHRTIPTTPTIPAPRPWSWSHGRALPPTMKQRIRAEAHGKSPRCRHRPLTEDQTEIQATQTETTQSDRDPAKLDC